MALIKCCECATEVSEFADKCPKCGCPVSVSLEKIAATAKETEQKKAEEEKLAAEKAAEKEQKAEERRQKFQANKKKIIISSCIAAVVLCASAACAIYYGYILPQKAALSEYSAAIEEYNTQVDEYNELITNLAIAAKKREGLLTTAKDLLESNAVTFDENTKVELSTAAEALQGEALVPPESLEPAEKISLTPEDEKLGPNNLKDKTAALLSAADKLGKDFETATAANSAMSAGTYLSLVEDLDTKIAAFETSVKIEQQLTDPSEAFILEKLAKAESVVEAQPVTETHDPNGKLHKPGGYTSAIYFTHTYLPSGTTGEAIIDIGTDGGGCIEVYATKEDAAQRDSYLGAFDGTIFDSGSHKVIGSIIIRTSCNLTATNQQILTQELIDVFSELE